MNAAHAPRFSGRPACPAACIHHNHGVKTSKENAQGFRNSSSWTTSNCGLEILNSPRSHVRRESVTINVGRMENTTSAKSTANTTSGIAAVQRTGRCGSGTIRRIVFFSQFMESIPPIDDFRYQRSTHVRRSAQSGPTADKTHPCHGPVFRIDQQPSRQVQEPSAEQSCFQ